FVHGPTTYVITYEQRNVVRSFADTDADEFYWDANGTGWAQPFHAVTVRVHVDEALAGLLTGEAACYVGAFGGTEPCDVERVDESAVPLFVAGARGLEAFETLTVAVGFARGTFTQFDPFPVPGGPGGPGGEFPDGEFPFAPVSDAGAFWIDAASYGSTALIVLGTGFTVFWRFVR